MLKVKIKKVFKDIVQTCLAIFFRKSTFSQLRYNQKYQS